MAVYRYEELTHQELSALPRDRTVVLFSAGPMEEHSLHLPLGTDALTSKYFNEQIAKSITEKHADWNVILFPTFFAGSDVLIYRGSIEVHPDILRRLLFTCGAQLAKDGFKFLLFMGAHGGPRHMVLLEEVAAKLRWRHRVNAVCVSSRLLQDVLMGKLIDKIASKMESRGALLNDEDRVALKTDYHGGMLETSIMMVVRPDLVKPTYKELSPAIVDKFWKISKKSGQKVGEGLGHLGSPHRSSLALGQAAIEVFIDEIQEKLEQFLEGKDVHRHFRSWFYFVPIFRTHFMFLLLFVFTAVLFILGTNFISRAIFGFYSI